MFIVSCHLYIACCMSKCTTQLDKFPSGNPFAKNPPYTADDLHVCAVANISLGNLEVTWCIAAGAATALHHRIAAGVAVTAATAKFYVLELRMPL